MAEMTDLALFDLEPVAPVRAAGKTDQELHEGLTRDLASWRRVGYCTATQWDWHPDPETGWYGAHVCTRGRDHGGRHKCDRCAREWKDH